MCSCNVIGSLDISCDAILGDCTCKDNIVGIVCNRPADGYYYKTLDDIIFEAEYAERSSVSSTTNHSSSHLVMTVALLQWQLSINIVEFNIVKQSQ